MTKLRKDQRRMMETNVAAFTNVKKRDGKRGPYDGCAGGFGIAWTLVVRLPFLLFCVLPAALLTTIVAGIGRRCCPRGAVERDDDLDDDDDDDEVIEPSDAVPLSQRKFDVVFLGASGFTGRLAARYMAERYPRSAKWALAGRSITKLEKVRAELANDFDRDLARLDILIVDTTDNNSLAAMCSQTRVVATSVGPFGKYGTPVVRQCVAYGCAMVDTTGEAAWVRDCTGRFYADAQRTGARIVNFCGHDCIPADLCVLQLSEALADASPRESLARVELFDDGRGVVSGGTIQTFLYHLTTYRSRHAPFSPLDLERDGSRSEVRTKSFVRVGPGYSSVHHSWYAWFYLSAVNMACVRRSNVLNHYGERLEYKEQLVLPGFWAAVAWVVNNALLGCFILNPSLRAVVDALGMLPSSGDGPTEAQMDKGYYVQHGHGFGTGGSQVSVQMYFPTDTMYRLTAQMFVESAMCFVFQDDGEHAEIERDGGFYTPASCFGVALRNRLLAADICEIETKHDATTVPIGGDAFADDDNDDDDDYDGKVAAAYLGSEPMEL